MACAKSHRRHRNPAKVVRRIARKLRLTVVRACLTMTRLAGSAQLVPSMTILDLLCLAVIAAGLLLDHFVLWSAFVRRSRVDPGPARRWIWSAWMGLLWALTACGAAVWLQEQRPFSALGFVVPHGWRLLVAAGLVSLLVVAYGRTLAKLAQMRC